MSIQTLKPGVFAFGLFLFSFLLFSIFAWSRTLQQSNAPHFVYLAEAFLNGQIHISRDLPNLNDWAYFGDKFYVSFPPLPSLLMLPGVAIFGHGFNDVLFTIFFSALNCALFFLALTSLNQNEKFNRNTEELLWLTILFSFGSVNFFCSVQGQVWYTAHIIGLTCTIGFLMAAYRASYPLLAGLLTGMGFLCRTPLLFGAVYFLIEVFRMHDPFIKIDAPKIRWIIIKKISLFLLPLMLIGCLQAGFNYKRFEDPFEFGHRYLYKNRVTERIQKWGLFNYRYLEQNLHAAFTSLPKISHKFPYLLHHGHGVSIFLVTPALLLLLWPRRKTPFGLNLLCSAVIISIPAFFYQNSGWYQFSYRFSLDYTPYLILLLAAGGIKIDSKFKLLIVCGLVVNAWGAFIFNRYFL